MPLSIMIGRFFAKHHHRSSKCCFSFFKIRMITSPPFVSKKKSFSCGRLQISSDALPCLINALVEIHFPFLYVSWLNGRLGKLERPSRDQRAKISKSKASVCKTCSSLWCQLLKWTIMHLYEKQALGQPPSLSWQGALYIIYKFIFYFSLQDTCLVPAGEQRWHHGMPSDVYRGRLRDAAGGQPPGPLPADVTPARDARLECDSWVSLCSQVPRAASERQHMFRDSPSSPPT